MSSLFLLVNRSWAFVDNHYHYACQISFSAKCPVRHSEYNLGSKPCGGEYSKSKEDHKDYLRGWVDRNSGKSALDSFQKVENREDPWKYYTQAQLDSHPFMCQLHTYPGSGYARSLGKTRIEANKTMVYLKRNLWIDNMTRAVFVEFSTYNNNANFYCIVTLVLEFNPDGGGLPYWSIITTRLDRYTNEFSYFLAACEISFLLLTLYYMWLELTTLHRQRMAYFQHFSSFVEILTFFLTWAAFGILMVRLGVVKWTKKKYKENGDKFTSFQYAASTDLAYGYTLAAVVFLASLKVLKLFRFNKNMLMLIKTLQYASKDLRYYFVFFAIPFMAYIQWAMLTFGRLIPDHSTFVRSFMSTLSLLIRAKQFRDLSEANRVLGPLFFLSFAILLGIILMKMFLSIVVEAFRVVRKDMRNRKNEYDILEFYFEKMMSFLPCLNRRNAKEVARAHYEKPHENENGRSVITNEDDRMSAVLEKIDKMNNAVNRRLLAEYEEIDEIAQLALKIKRRRHQTMKKI
eukprot:Seg1837.8 transcript_id=Seg1837.8/GoldUCD/mRNA.D3Y31 product=Polycystin-2 protein_id=Seg1837.8/GoldUCD/D3Y31